MCSVPASGTSAAASSKGRSRFISFVVCCYLLLAAACAPSDPRATAVSVGSLPCVLKSDGTIWCWGGDSGMRAPDPSEEFVAAFGQVRVPQSTKFTEVGVGEFHACGLDINGAVWCWGRNWMRQLGDGTLIPSSTPVRATLPPDTTFSTISVGMYHTCGLATDGVWCWGYNGAAQAGAGRRTRSTALVKVPLPASVSITAISSGDYHTCALASDGSGWCWGSNSDRQIGDGVPPKIYGRIPHGTHFRPTQVEVPDGIALIDLAAGGNHTCALAATGEAWCWGDRFSLGDGIDYELQLGPIRPVPVAMPTGVTFSAISAGAEHTCALATDGSAWCWGGLMWVTRGTLGDGTGKYRMAPTAVTMPPSVTFTAISAGDASTCALATDGTVWCWGMLMRAAGDDVEDALSPVELTSVGSR